MQSQPLALTFGNNPRPAKENREEGIMADYRPLDEPDNDVVCCKCDKILPESETFLAFLGGETEGITCNDCYDDWLNSTNLDDLLEKNYGKEGDNA